MKILITTDLYTVTTNGVVTSVRNLYEELTRSGHEVRILTLSESGRSRKEGDVYYIRSVSLERVYPQVRMPTSYRHRLIRELVRWKPDVIHSQCEFFTFQYAQRISKLTGAPIVHTYHTLYEQYVGYLFKSKRLGRRVVKVLSRKRLKRVKRVIAPTHKVEDALRDYGMKNPISIVPSGIDLEQSMLRISAEERQERRLALGIENDRFVLLNLGRLGTEKRVEELLCLFADARKENPSLIFLIVGDGPARKQLIKQCDELGITDSVIFTGMVDPKQVHCYYQLADLFVSASTSETQGLTYVEAAANGLPLLCREDPCLQDVLLLGQNGYTYSDERGFMDALLYIVSDSKWRESAGLKSRELASRFDKRIFADSVESVYDCTLKV